MKTIRDIAIIGAGPAGLAAALMLHRRGHRVTMIERFEAARPIGSGLMLQPTGMSVLASLGLLETVLSRGARIDRLYGLDGQSRRPVLDVRYDAMKGGRFGLGIHRASLFSTLADAVMATDCTWLTAHEVVGLRRAAGKAIPLDRDGNELGTYDLVVDASGSSSALAASLPGGGPGKALAYGAYWATLPASAVEHDPHALAQRYRRASVMVGLLPVGRQSADHDAEIAFFWSLKTADDPAVRAAGIDAWKRAVLVHWPELAGLLDHIRGFDDLTLARYRHRTVGRPCADRLVLIGDAAHSTSPQLGQGANMALLDAAVLAHALDLCPDDLAEALTLYAQSRRLHVQAYQMLSLLFTPFYQGDSRLLPLVRDRFVAALARLGPVSGLLAHIVSGLLAAPFRGAGLMENDWRNIRPQD